MTAKTPPAPQQRRYKYIVAYSFTTAGRTISGLTRARVDRENGIYMLPLSCVGCRVLQTAATGEVDGRPIASWCRVLGADPHLRLLTGPA